MQGQQTLFTKCVPEATTTNRAGYVSHCACGWQSATERTKRYALAVLAYHLDQTFKELLKGSRTAADKTV